MPTKRGNSTQIVKVTAVFVAVILAAFGGFLGGQRFERFYLGLPPGGVANADTSPDKAVDFSLFWKAWNLVGSKYYGQADDTQRVEGAIAGMVASLGDPYTAYLEPSSNTLFQSDLEGSFGGIGAELTLKNGLLTIVSALSDTPAERAGLRGGDVILEVDGAKVGEMSFNDAILKIRGEKGTEVRLSIAREGREEPFEVKLARETIVVKSVETESIGEGGSVAYVKVNDFGADTVGLLRSALRQAKADGKDGVVLDLRDNPGGYLDVAVRAVGLVLPETISSDEPRLKDRVAVVERTKNGNETVEATSEAPEWADGKLVVLINGGSASASEIFAGAMRDYGRATLVGTKSFGKGSVQELSQLGNGGGLKVTVAKWFTPLGTGIDGTGIKPDVEVELPQDARKSKDDVQVMKALEALRQ